jgi:hypothetical protein
LGIVVCNETQHSPIVNGQTQFLLPNDPPGYVVGLMPVTILGIGCPFWP